MTSLEIGYLTSGTSSKADLIPYSSSSFSIVGQKSCPTPVSTSCVMIAQELAESGQYQIKGICFSPVLSRTRTHNQSTKFSTVVSTGHAGNVIFDQSCRAIR